MADNPPKTLPPDFFDKKSTSSGPPQTLPADFFDSKPKVDTPDPTKPAPGTKFTDLYELPSENLLNLGPIKRGSPEQEATVKRGMAAAPEFIKDVRSMAGTAIGGSTFGAASKGLPLLMRMLASSSGAGAGAGLGELTAGAKPKEALKSAATTTAGALATEGVVGGAAKVGSAIASKGEPLARINKLLGVGTSDVIPGKIPASLDEFAANPARGAAKYGLDEKALAKLNPLERNQAIMAARDKAGQALDRVLQQNGDKTVNVQNVIKDVFGQITDKNVAAKVQDRLMDIVARNGIDRPLSQLTPMQARAVRRGLDKFADFAPTDTVESMKQAATALRRGISEATRKAVPESAPFDQDYTDLYHASQGTQKLVKEYATTVPENKLRKYLIKAALGGGLATGGALAWEFLKPRGGTPTIPVP